MDVLMRTMTVSLLTVGLYSFPMSMLPTQTTARQPPDLVIRSLAGRDLFEFYCASCHGRDGKGRGHVASALKKAPPDLTLLTQRNRGNFPAARVEDTIRGGNRASIRAHGSSEMPVWGPIFKGLDNRSGVNEERINSLVKYIESIQARAKADRQDPRTVRPVARAAR